MPITQYSGKNLLERDIVSKITKEADAVVRNKDVSQAWQASAHLKRELASMPQESIAPVLDSYRRITSKLKALALPLLDAAEVEHLLEHNLGFLDTGGEEYLVQGLSAWLASQPDNAVSKLKQKLQSKVDKTSPFAPKILSVLSDHNQGSDIDSEPAIVSENDEFLNAKEAGEINTHSKVVQAVGAKVRNTAAEAEALARQIYSLSQTNSPEHGFAKRAKALIDSRLRDVRTSLDISQYLSRPYEAGGLGLTGEALEKSSQIIEDSYNRTHTNNNLKTALNRTVSEGPTGRFPHESTSQQNVDSGIISHRKNLSSKSEKKQIPQKKEAKIQIDELIKKEASQDIGIENIVKSSSAKQPLPSKPIQKPDQSKPKQIQQKPIPRAQTSQKPRLDDIVGSAPKQRPQAQVVGLSGEFKTIDLQDFRAAGGANSAIQHFVGKIKALESQSVADKMEAIDNFKQSPVYKQYLGIGDEGLAQGKNLSKALADASLNPDKMTQEEFFAIADLNSKLK